MRGELVDKEEVGRGRVLRSCKYVKELQIPSLTDGYKVSVLCPLHLWSVYWLRRYGS